MRETIVRDRNHPAIIAWCLFNESWGLGDDGFKADRDTQNWVLRMWTEVKRELDPSRLIEDNSPSRYDHVQTDLNSWHFYIDDYRRAREHIDEMVRRTVPGSPLNYVPGRSAGTAPLINSQYGAVSARGGDRDVSWGFRYLTTQLRRHELIQGYVYTQLSDVEWEHNGIVDYDRSAKEFGYGAFVPGMTIRDLQGADFVGFDAPPSIEAFPGEVFTLPIFVSHYSRRKHPPTLKWRITGIDSLGRPVATDPQTWRVAWEPYRVTYQRPLKVRVPRGRPFVGALTLELLDEKGDRIAANFVNLIVYQALEDSPRQAPSAEGSPRVEVLGPRLVAVRFEPGDFASFRTDDSSWDWLNDRGKFSASGACEVEYHLALPKFVRDALPTGVVMMAELATKASGQRLDWPSRRRPLDYPQTQQRKYPGTASVHLLDHELWEFELPDDPADARGVLSHHARYQPGSYGYLVRKRADLTRYVALREAMQRQPFFPLVFRTTGEGHGLSIYSARLGRYPIDPTLIFQTARDMQKPAGWTSNQPVTIHRLLDRSRLVHGVRTAQRGGHEWRYTTEPPGEGWTGEAFDDSIWNTGTGGFGRGSPPGIHLNTPWTTSEIWLRTELQLPARPLGMMLRYYHCEDVEIYVNGRPLFRATGGVSDYQQRPLTKAEMDLFQVGRNTIAAHGRHTYGGQGIDLGMSWIEVEAEVEAEEEK